MKNFGTVRQKFSDGISSYHPPPPPHFLSIEFFASGNFLKHSKDRFPYERVRHSETKSFRRKISIPPPPLLSINFFATGNFLKHSTESFPCERVRQCKTKVFRRKILKPPLPIHIVFRYRIFFRTQRKSVPLRIFSAL